MSDFASASYTAGQLNAIVKKMRAQQGPQAVERFLRGELGLTGMGLLNRRWREKDGIIYFSVTSDGTTGEEWITRLEAGGCRAGDLAQSVLRSEEFQPTSGLITEVAVLKGELFADSERYTKTIRHEAGNRGWLKPNAEVSCLIREKISDDDMRVMGLEAIIGMHEPITSKDRQRLLASTREFNKGYLYAYWRAPDGGWERDKGFAFAVSQS